MGLHVLILISVDQAGEEREQTGRIEEGIWSKEKPQEVSQWCQMFLQGELIFRGRKETEEESKCVACTFLVGHGWWAQAKSHHDLVPGELWFTTFCLCFVFVMAYLNDTCCHGLWLGSSQWILLCGLTCLCPDYVACQASSTVLLAISDSCLTEDWIINWSQKKTDA